MPPNARAKPDAVEALADAIHSASIHLLRRLRREDAATPLGPARLSALSVIVFGGPMRISAVARAEQVRTPTITPIVAALEREGLIARQADERDGRASILRATRKGEKLMAAARRRRVRVLAARLRRLPSSERRLLTAAVVVLEKLTRDRVL